MSPRRSVTSLALLVLTAAGCFDTSAADQTSGAAVSGARRGASLDAGSESERAVVDTEDAGQGPGQDAQPRYVIGVWTTEPRGAWVGNLLVVPDLAASSTVDLSDALTFEDDMAYATPGNGQVFVGRGGTPVVERYTLQANDELKLDGRMSLARYGVSSGMGTKDPLCFVSASRAYFIDEATLQVVVFDPGTLQTAGSFSLAGFAHDLYPTHELNAAHRDGKRLLLSARYWRDDGTAAQLTRVAIIDTDHDSVRYIDDTRCGNIAYQAHDSQNNLYLATHTYQTTAIAAGVAGEPVAQSCIVRVKAGADRFDSDYYVNLDELADGSAGGLMQGRGDEAFVLVYAGELLTANNHKRAGRANNWELFGLTLGKEKETFSKVTNLDKQSSYSLAFVANDTPYVTSVKDDLSAGAYWMAASSKKLESGMSVPGYPGAALKLR